MSSVDRPPVGLRLSICIPTFNRAAFIGLTLDSIISQASSQDLEIVVLDGASTDNTESVVQQRASVFDRLRYIRQDTNNGFDRDCNRVVELARGEYCWLMTDDDLFKPGAVKAVLEALRRECSLIVVTSEACDYSMTRVLQRRWLNLDEDRVFGPSEMDGLFTELGDVLKYVGGIVIRRSIWLEREKESYYGSSFVYVGVIFQKSLPGEALVIAHPLISYRTGNSHEFSPRMFEIMFFKWPSLVWSLALSQTAKQKICHSEPWRDNHSLLLYRGWGYYDWCDYERLIRPRLRSGIEGLVPALIAGLPGVIVNAVLILYYSMTRRTEGLWQPNSVLQLLRDSRFYFRKWFGHRNHRAVEKFET